MLLSIESEAIKAGKKQIALQKSLVKFPLYRNLISHFPTIKRWGKFVWKQNIIIRPFDIESKKIR